MSAPTQAELVVLLRDLVRCVMAYGLDDDPDHATTVLPLCQTIGRAWAAIDQAEAASQETAP